jgi:hypothetical protein
VQRGSVIDERDVGLAFDVISVPHVFEIGLVRRLGDADRRSLHAGVIVLCMKCAAYIWVA